MNYPNVVKLFENLPKIGWGLSKVFNDTYEDWLNCWEILAGSASLLIISHRAIHLQECKTNNTPEIDFKEWFDNYFSKRNEYIMFLMEHNNFVYYKGDFYLQKFSKDILERLADIYIDYKNLK